MTVNVAVCPAETVVLCGCAVIAGAVPFPPLLAFVPPQAVSAKIIESISRGAACFISDIVAAALMRFTAR